MNDMRERQKEEKIDRHQTKGKNDNLGLVIGVGGDKIVMLLDGPECRGKKMEQVCEVGT